MAPSYPAGKDSGMKPDRTGMRGGLTTSCGPRRGGSSSRRSAQPRGLKFEDEHLLCHSLHFKLGVGDHLVSHTIHCLLQRPRILEDFVPLRWQRREAWNGVVLV